MTPTTTVARVPDEAVREYLRCLADAYQAGALRVARDLLRQGVPLPSVLTDLVCAAQARVGELWEGAEWDVAREHAATAVSDSVVAALTLGTGVRPTQGRVLVACVESEWHALPARVVAECLRLAGWQVTFLGAATPASSLARYLHDVGPDAVAVSCMVPTGLADVRQTIVTCREAGVPVLAGGRAFGSDARRAELLGAQAWAPDARAASTALATLPPFASPAPPLPTEAAHATVVRHRDDLVAATVDGLASRVPLLATYDDRQRARTREDVGHIVDHLAAAVLVDDPRLFAEFTPWLVRVVTARGVPEAAVRATYVALTAALADLPADATRALEIVAAAAG